MGATHNKAMNSALFKALEIYWLQSCVRDLSSPFLVW
jgi:hypothetical protein